jgi:hypothetical protein
MKHEIPNLERHTRPTGTFVTIRARDDLDPSSGQLSVEHSGRSVTAVPENVGLCQVVAIGPDVTNVQPGDICFIDFYDVAQGYLVSGEELYVTQAMALRMRLDIETEPFLHPVTRTQKQHVTKCEIHPLPGYVLTKHAPDRMTVAVTGHDRQIIPRNMTTSGIVGGRNSDGDPCTFVCYEEVVEFTPGAIQQERYHEGWDGRPRDTYYEERRLRAKIQRLEAGMRSLIDKDHPEGSFSRATVLAVYADLLPANDTGDWRLAVGDLVCFCSEFSIQFRALGELYRCVPYKNLLAVIDDRAILSDYNATHPPPPLVQLIGGGAERLYGT